MDIPAQERERERESMPFVNVPFRSPRDGMMSTHFREGHLALLIPLIQILPHLETLFQTHTEISFSSYLASFMPVKFTH